MKIPCLVLSVIESIVAWMLQIHEQVICKNNLQLIRIICKELSLLWMFFGEKRIFCKKKKDQFCFKKSWIPLIEAVDWLRTRGSEEHVGEFMRGRSSGDYNRIYLAPCVRCDKNTGF